MKRNYQIVISLLFAILILASCSKKEDEKIAPSILIGKWKDMGIKGSISINFNGQKATQIFDTLGTGLITEFKSDSTIIDFGYIDGNLKFAKFTNTSNQLTVFGTNGNKTYDFKFNFQLNGNTLLLSMDKVLFGENIAKLKAAGINNELTVYNEFVPFITEFKYEQTFLKQ